MQFFSLAQNTDFCMPQYFTIFQPSARILGMSDQDYEIIDLISQAGFHKFDIINFLL